MLAMSRRICIDDDAYEAMVRIGAMLSLRDGEKYSMADIEAELVNAYTAPEIDTDKVKLVRKNKKK